MINDKSMLWEFSTKSGEPVRSPDGVTLMGVLVARGHMLLAWVPGKMLRYYGSSKNVKGAIIDDEMNINNKLITTR
jgi:hypothetical protein